jgi:flagellar assembly factor FliW
LNGLPGFENLNKFTILDIEDQQSLKCLQSIEDRDICLLIASPWNYVLDYEIKIPEEELNELQIKTETDMNIYSVIRVQENLLYANLVAPIIININSNIGKQIIISNSKYDVRQAIACL